MYAVFLLVLTLAGLTAANDSYVVVSPSVIRPGVPCTVSVNILKASGVVHVQASIIRQSTKTAVVSPSGDFMQGQPGQLSIQIPRNLTNDRYTLEIAGTGGLTFTNSTTVRFETKQMSIFIQTDKAMYKPGDKVNFKVLTVYPDLKPYNDPVDIYISDASSNKIRQYKGVTGEMGVVTSSLTLSTQPVLGDWKIQVNAKGSSQSKMFTVAEYVLPKFEVTVTMPSYVVSTDNDVTFTVKTKYTYGKSVKGKLDVAVKMLYQWQDEASNKDPPIFTTTTQIDGETKVNFPMSAALAVSKYINNRKFIVTADVTESLTGNKLSGSGSVQVYSTGTKLEFPSNNPNTFKPGLRYVAYLKVSQQDGLPVAPSKLQVNVSTRVTSLKDPSATQPPNTFWWSPQTVSTNLPVQTLSVPVDGLVMINVDVPTNAKDIYLSAHYDKSSASKSLSKSYSPSDSYIQLSLLTANAIKSGNGINLQVKGTQALGQMVYQILSRGQIVHMGTIDGKGQKTVSFGMTTSSKMSPNARIVLYYVRADGEIVTDSISFDVQGIFKNKVAISINETMAEPGDTVKVTVKADPLSHAHILAVDQSVLLLKSGNDITAEDVSTELKTYDSTHHNTNYNDIHFGGGFGGPVLQPRGRRAKRAIWWPYPIFLGGSDAHSIFENAGVVVLTDALVFQHKEPIHNRFWPMSHGFGFNKFAFSKAARRLPKIDSFSKTNTADSSSKPLKTPERVRKDFSESWILSTSIDQSGQADLVTKVPDTITSWVATAFAVNPTSGLGVSPSAAKFKVFRPFFVSLNLPYSVIRGENVALQAIVFNYMQIDQTVRVTLLQSNSFYNIKVDAYGKETTAQGDAVQNVMVKAGEAKSVYFPIIPIGLGKVDLEVKAQSTQAADAVRRQLLVEAEGTPKEYNMPVLIEIQGGQFTKTLDLSLPPNVVAGSELAKVSVIGDIMGPSISGLDKLLRMPTGCGEQTMLGLAPDVYITEYLTSTNQLMGEVKSKAIDYMEKGYQRELTYKHTDGSFSAFGNNDKSGSMWLTAFVSRVFHQAKSHIFVDENVLKTAINWMVLHQNSNGSFPEPGRIIHKNMQGNAGSGASLTTFVFISLLENRDLYEDNSQQSHKFQAALMKALNYVETAATSTTDLYLMAMASYALQLAGSSRTDQVLAKLDQLASHEGGLYHLHQPESKKATKGSWHSPNPTSAVDTEMTSYVLMTYALRQDVAFGRKIMQWVTKQRNSNGGFSSTQDTVVALNALTMMAKQLYSRFFNLNVDVALDWNPIYSFHVNYNNSAILQRRETTKIPSKVQVTASGSGTALAEVAVFFNVESEIEDTTFELQVMLLEETINKLKIQTCSKWLGDGTSSGMAVQEIGIPSGFAAIMDSFVIKASDPDILKRKETEDKKVILYFDEISTQSLCVTFEAERVGLVSKSQPAVIRVYDYYEPSNQVTGFYQSQILKNSNICSICPECDNNCVSSP